MGRKFEKVVSFQVRPKFKQKTAQADEKVEALTRDVRHAIGTVDAGDKQRDSILRAELSANPSLYSLATIVF